MKDNSGSAFRDDNAAELPPAGEARMGLRERKKVIRLQRIIAASRSLFIDKGFSQTTIQDIAAAAEVGLGTLYLYAKSKEDLLILVFKELFLEMIEDSFMRVDQKKSLLEQILMFFEAQIEYHKKDIVMSRTVLKEISFSNTPQRKEDIDQIMSHTYARLTEIIQRASRAEGSKQMYAGTVAWSSFALYYHLLQGFLCGFVSEQEVRKDLRNALHMLLN
jgi:AcrR family transcriptional regulator